MFRGLFRGRCHPKYQLIEMYDSMQRYLQPEDLRNFTEKYETRSRTNDRSKGQGFDFILEEINKLVKTWIRKFRQTACGFHFVETITYLKTSEKKQLECSM